MKLGIVIVTFECREFALRCLGSIERYLPGQLATTIVVDNASHDGTVAFVRSSFPGVRIIGQRRNRGFATAANTGIRSLGDVDVVCLVNPDAEFLDPGLFDVASALDADSTAGVAGIRIENADGTLQASCRAFPGHFTALFNRHSLMTRFVPKNRWSQRYLMTSWSHAERRDVDWVSGACMLIHRRALHKVGLLDSHYFFGIEDVDYCQRVHAAGLRVIYDPRTAVRHLIGRSSRHNAYHAIAAQHAGMWRYYQRHLRGSAWMDVATALGIGIRLGVHTASYTVRRGIERLRERQR